MEEMWSNTDFPYMCLKDEKRTLAFRKAIYSVIKKGDIVLDMGSGSGILSFFASEAGASKVYAIEIDHTLATALRKSVQENGLTGTVEVIEGDALTVTVPEKVNVLIAEMIETGLLDELQVPAINNLWNRKVVTNATTFVPTKYTTNAELTYSDNKYYGFTIFSPKHEWPFYENKDTDWLQNVVKVVSNKIQLTSVDFTSGIIDENVTINATFHMNGGKRANGIKISGIIDLCKGIQLGPTNALNGDKIIPIDEVVSGGEVTFKISYKMGGGMQSLKIVQI